jgi:hypothetical protein
MKSRVGYLLLWLLVVAVGIEIGAGLYEARVLVPLWSSAPPESLIHYNLQTLRPMPGQRFWIVSTPLVGLLGLANLVVGWLSTAARRRWWLLGAGGVVVMVVITFVYFVPALMGFEAVRAGADGSLAASVNRWVILNWIRAAIYMAAWLCLLHAYHGTEQLVGPERR